MRGLSPAAVSPLAVFRGGCPRVALRSVRPVVVRAVAAGAVRSARPTGPLHGGHQCLAEHGQWPEPWQTPQVRPPIVPPPPQRWQPFPTAMMICRAMCAMMRMGRPPGVGQVGDQGPRAVLAHLRGPLLAFSGMAGQILIQPRCSHSAQPSPLHHGQMPGITIRASRSRVRMCSSPPL